MGGTFFRGVEPVNMDETRLITPNALVVRVRAPFRGTFSMAAAAGIDGVGIKETVGAVCLGSFSLSLIRTAACSERRRWRKLIDLWDLQGRQQERCACYVSNSMRTDGEG